MRAALVLTMLAVSLPAASAHHGLALTSADPVLLDGELRVEAARGALWSDAVDHTGTLVWRNVTGKLALWTTQSARAQAEGHSAAFSTADARVVERELSDATLRLVVSAEPFALVVLASEGSVAVSGMSAEQGVPERLSVPLRSSTGAGVTPFRQREPVAWEWPAEWAFVGDIQAYEVPLQGFPVPAAASADVRGPALAEIYGGTLDIIAADGQVESFALGEAGDGTRIEQTWAVLDGAVGSADLALPAAWALAGPAMSWSFDGRVRWTGASGAGHVGGESVAFTDAALEGRGNVRIAVAPPSTAIAPATYGAEGAWTTFSIDGAPVVQPQGTLAPVLAASALAAILALLARLGLPLYMRFSRDELLAHPRRALLFRLVCEEPGIHQRELARRSGIGWGAFRGHLEYLIATGYLKRERRGRYTLVFPTGTSASGLEIPNPQARAVLAALPADGSAIELRALRERLAISRQLLNYHARMLAQAGAARVVAAPDGRALARNVPPGATAPDAERASAP